MLGLYALGRTALGRRPEEGAYALSAEVGSFVWTGHDADLYSLILTAEAGSFAWAGQDADLYSLILTAEAGSFAWAGQDAGGAFNINFECEAGSFVWTGHDADLYSLILTAEAGSFVWTGMDADRAQTRVLLRAKGSSTPFLNLASGGGGRLTLRGGRAC